MKNKDNIKKRILRTPVIGQTIKILICIARLPSTEDRVLTMSENLRTERQSFNKEFGRINDALKDTVFSQDLLNKQLRLLEKSIGSHGSAKKEASSNDRLFADDHALDIFYATFEDRFRGTEKMIGDRLKEYLPYFQKSEINFKKFPVLDIGSGRGEFLQLMKTIDIPSIGLDINHDMVSRSKKKGLNTIQGDALSHLESIKPQTYGAITGFHLVEHIPFGTLYRILQNCHTSLAQNGFVIFETPNPENLTVGSTTFYMDPSHLNPIPPALLAFALETCGFSKVEILRLHPDEKIENKKNPSDIERLLYSARDYSVIGYK
jgi:O-antigen chain-terminating methyltransferase